LKKNYCRFCHHRFKTNGQLSFIDERQERERRKIKFIIFSIIFPSVAAQTVSPKNDF
jgi:hypothetical protein